MVHVDKIEYKPMPVRDLLVEMKDLSELMLDLAYSAALFHSHELAEEVLELENHVDTLSYILKMNTMLAARDAEDAEALVAVSIVASATNKISDSAADIAALALREVHIHPIVREAFSKVEEQLVRVKVESESVLDMKTLKELGLAARIGVDVIAIRRKRNWIINPKGNAIIRIGDILFARGAPKGVEEFQMIAKGSLKKIGE